MIPAIAVIISAYAVARLLCEYVFVEDQFKLVRILLSLIAVAIIFTYLMEIVFAAADLSDLGI